MSALPAEVAARRKVILAVDDEPRILSTMERILTGADGRWRYIGVQRPREALELLDGERPDLVLLDVRMPEMDGYELCSRILDREELKDTPVVFVTAWGDEEDRARAFAVGATELVTKPFDPRELKALVARLLGSEVAAAPRKAGVSRMFAPTAWADFKEYLRKRLDAGPDSEFFLARASPARLYELSESLGAADRLLARCVSDFLDVGLVASIDANSVSSAVLPAAFCRAHLIVPTRMEGGLGAIVANPFEMEVLDALSRLWQSGPPRLAIAEPHVIRSYFAFGGTGDGTAGAASDEHDVRLNADRLPDASATRGDSNQLEIMGLTNEILRRAVSERASDLHIEPKEDHSVLRLRIDGDLEEFRRIGSDQSRRLIARFKALGDMDIAEKRKPQDGALEAVVQGRRFKLRLATTTTPQGESLVIRFLDPFAQPPTLEELGASAEQADMLRAFMSRSAGLVLVVGPTGSGKSTTIFSLLDSVGGDRRSVITVEDPVEYRIPFANQQQVDERAGVTMESLLRSAVRQDPDILLLGEIRDLYSAKASLDFSSSGHLTVSSIHSANSTTAVFRLERLGVERGAMADAILGVVAQKLLKRLCEHCRLVRRITDSEARWLEPFTDDVPTEVAEPLGCPECRGTGFKGRTGVYEVLRFDPHVARAVRDGASVAELRNLVADRGDVLIGRHAVDKVRDLLCSPRQVHEGVMLEEMRREANGERSQARPVPIERRSTGDDSDTDVGDRAGGAGISLAEPPAVFVEDGADGAERAPKILVVEDDPDGRALIERHLTGGGYDVLVAGDGAEALMYLGSHTFDLVLSDINMPNLDGLRLVEIMSQKGIQTPVVFLTGQSGEEAEVQSLEMGVEDFLTKPVKKNVLRLRIQKVLERHAASVARG